MSESAVPTLPTLALDDPWRRLPWVVLASLCCWLGVLSGFAMVLQHPSPPPADILPLDARLVELPLQGGSPPGPPEVSASPAATPEPAPPPPTVAPQRTRPQPVTPTAHPQPKRKIPTKAREIVTAPPSPPTHEGEQGSDLSPGLTTPATEGGLSAEATAGVVRGAAGEGGSGGGTGTGHGIGAGSTGARALYAPVPRIPDDLRQEIFETFALARFQITAEGRTEVTLTTPTSNPRLNQVLLATLKEWRFFPAMKEGKPIASAFEVRIPIVVR